MISSFTNECTRALPNGFFVISLDFELAWGSDSDPTRVEPYRRNLLGARDAIPRILDIFAQYKIHATWAVVGFLFCSNRDELLEILPVHKPAYENQRLSPYNYLDQIGRSEEDDPLHYAPSLIKLIKNYPDQEIGSHTFSHYYCLEPGQDIVAFEDDLRSAILAARRIGIELKSLVFPKNQIRNDYLGICRQMGFIAYRGIPQRGYGFNPCQIIMLLRRALRLADTYLPLTGNNFCIPRNEKKDVPVNVPASRFLRPWSSSLKFLEPIRLRRIFSEMTSAADIGTGYHLWWHPHNFGLNLEENLATLKRILDHFMRLREVVST